MSAQNRSRFKAFVFTLILSVMGTELSAQSGFLNSTGTMPNLGFGTYVNMGVGTNGFTAVPGFTALFGRFPVKAHIGYVMDTLDLAVNVDWLVLNTPIYGTPFSWYVGPGVYAGWAKNLGALSYDAYAVGSRGVFGGRTLLADTVESYLALTPALGFAVLAGQPRWLWNVDVEVGFRYLMRIKKNVLRGKYLPSFTRLGMLRAPVVVKDSVTVAEMVPETFAETVPETIAETVPETFAEMAPETFAETAPETFAETVPETVREVERGFVEIAAVPASFDQPDVMIQPMPEPDTPDSAPANDAFEVTSPSSIQEESVTELPKLVASIPSDQMLVCTGDSFVEPLEIAVSIENIAPVINLSFEVLDGQEMRMKLVEGTGALPASMTWDGAIDGSELFLPKQAYSYKVQEWGTLDSIRVVEGAIPKGLLVTERAEGYKIDLVELNFEPDEAALVKGRSVQGMKNDETMEKLYSMIGMLSGYSLTIVGHAVALTDDPIKEEPVLRRLSKARAEMIRTSLIQMGLDGDRITTVGMGGKQPLVPHTDRAARWQNRRVEIFLSAIPKGGLDESK